MGMSFVLCLFCLPAVVQVWHCFGFVALIIAVFVCDLCFIFEKKISICWCLPC